MHETTEAPEVDSQGPPIDPLDPEFIEKTIADSSIYEDLYNEYGMGEKFEPDSDDEDDKGTGEVRFYRFCCFAKLSRPHKGRNINIVSQNDLSAQTLLTFFRVC